MGGKEIAARGSITPPRKSYLFALWRNRSLGAAQTAGLSNAFGRWLVGLCFLGWGRRKTAPKNISPDEKSGAGRGLRKGKGSWGE